MSDNNIPKPKRTYKKRAPKATPKVVEDPPQPAVEKISHDDNSVEKVSVEVTYNFYLCTKCNFSTQDNNPDCSNCNAKSSMRLYQTSSQQNAILEHEKYMDNLKTSLQTSQQTSLQTSLQTSKKTLPAKYDKFILYGFYLINSILQSDPSSLNNPNPDPLHLAHLRDDLSLQIQFVDNFLNQFKDIKNNVKNILSNNNYNYNDSLVHNIVQAANSIPVQIVIVDNVKYFLTKDNNLLDFHTQRFVKPFS